MLFALQDEPAIKKMKIAAKSNVLSSATKQPAATKQAGPAIATAAGARMIAPAAGAASFKTLPSADIMQFIGKALEGKDAALADKDKEIVHLKRQLAAALKEVGELKEQQAQAQAQQEHDGANSYAILSKMMDMMQGVHNVVCNADEQVAGNDAAEDEQGADEAEDEDEDDADEGADGENE